MSSAASSHIQSWLSWRLTAALHRDSKPKHTHNNTQLCKRRFELLHFRSDFKEHYISSHEARLMFYIHIFDLIFDKATISRGAFTYLAGLSGKCSNLLVCKR